MDLEIWSGYDAGSEPDGFCWWVTGKNMRIVAKCKAERDAMLIVSQHNRGIGRKVEKAARSVEVFSHGVPLQAPEGDEWVVFLKSVLMADVEASRVLVQHIEDLQSK